MSPKFFTRGTPPPSLVEAIKRYAALPAVNIADSLSETAAHTQSVPPPDQTMAPTGESDQALPAQTAPTQTTPGQTAPTQTTPNATTHKAGEPSLEPDSSSESISEWEARKSPVSFADFISSASRRYNEPLHAVEREWTEDFLGPDYQCTTLELGEDDEGTVEATVVRYRPQGYQRTARAVLYVHGWCDYFFQTETAEFFHAQGAAFYAVDLRKYGRSLREGQTPGYIDSLSSYSDEIGEALRIIREEQGANVSIMLLGHSTGGLVCSLWAQHNPGQVSGLILNSPWLELQGSSVVRVLTTPGLAQLARVQPKAALPNVDYGFYNRTVSKEFDGEWDINTLWRPNPSWVARPGWLAAVTAGHAEVAKGLDIDVPVLVLTSAKTAIFMRWVDEIKTGDAVLDVEAITRRAVQLGSKITINRIKGGLHDLALSPKPVRAKYYEAMFTWLTAYGWSG